MIYLKVVTLTVYVSNARVCDRLIKTLGGGNGLRQTPEKKTLELKKKKKAKRKKRRIVCMLGFGRPTFRLYFGIF